MKASNSFYKKAGKQLKKTLTTILIITFLLLLLTFPTIALKGAKTGLLLWFQTVLPTLLPFMIVSNLMIKLRVTDCLTALFSPVGSRLFGLSRAGCYPFLIGMLSGYPVGAKACSDLVKANEISRHEGQYLLCFCNNASPMFILSFISMQCLGLNQKGFLVLSLVYGSAIMTGFLYRILHWHAFTSHSYNADTCQTAGIQTDADKISSFAILDQTILSAFEILVKAGGYIILFSILAELALHFTFIPEVLRFFVIGFLEITTGSAAISFSKLAFTKKIILTLLLTAFGGLSSHAQTYSVIMDSGLSIKTYFLFKCINACIAGILTLFLINVF